MTYRSLEILAVSVICTIASGLGPANKQRIRRKKVGGEGDE